MLKDREIALIPATGKSQKCTDHAGLYVFVSKAGGKSWRYDYRFGKQRRTVTFGRFPDLSTDDARELHRLARKQLAQGIDPARAKKLQKLARHDELGNTFGVVAEAWYASKCHLLSKVWQDSHRLLLDRDLFPDLKDVPLREITAPALKGVLQKAAKRANAETGRDGAKTAERARQTAVQVFDYARREIGWNENAARALKGWTVVPDVVHRAYLKERELPGFFSALRAYPGYPSTVFAAELLFRTMVRKTELTKAKWSEFDLRKALWIIPPERMKLPMGQKSNPHKAHEVPLSSQTVRLLQRLKSFAHGSEFVFPSNSSIKKPMSPTTLNAMFDRLGFHGRLTPHGIRATASTILNERGFRADAIERQLAHVERNGSRKSYNHASYFEERREMMQAWSDILDEVSTDAGDES